MALKRSLLFLCLSLALFSILPVHAPFSIFIVIGGQKATRLLQSANGSTILEAGSTVSGWVRVSGGQDNDIIFYVTDPNNVTVAGYGGITYAEFSFDAPMAGEYTAHFDNSFSQDPKSVSFNYSIAPPILGIPQTLFYIILFIILIAAVAVIVVVFIRRRRRKRQKEEETKKTSQKSL